MSSFSRLVDQLPYCGSLARRIEINVKLNMYIAGFYLGGGGGGGGNRVSFPPKAKKNFFQSNYSPPKKK